MGIYGDGKVYGVSWTVYDEYYKNILVEYEKKYTTQLNLLQIEEIQKDFTAISFTEPNYELTISFYTSCTDTYDTTGGSYMTWVPGNKKMLEELFEKGDILI